MTIYTDTALKEYLEKNHLKQKDFITQLIQQALDNAEE